MRNSICNQLLPQIAPLLWAGTLTHVFFYGAGCTPEKKVFVQKALEMVFKKAQIQVESDMVGAARGLLGHNAGVACVAVSWGYQSRDVLTAAGATVIIDNPSDLLAQ